MSTLIVDKSPSDEFSLHNQAVVCRKTADYAQVTVPGVVQECYLTLKDHSAMQAGKLGLSGLQREWLSVRIKEPLHLKECKLSRQQHLLGTISVEVDFYQKPKKLQEPINSDDMAKYFLDSFMDNVFCSDQPFIIGFKKPTLIKAKVLRMTAEILGLEKRSSKNVSFGIIHANTRVIFEKKPDSSLQLIGRHIGDSAHKALISPDWDFNQMGIGGLGNEFSDIFRRAFASRVFPPDVVEELGMKHVRGILLYGPPGTGKTLMARQIGKMLHAREPKIINGPEILNKYVGESELNVRNLFAEAETEQKKMGLVSALHIIIFDEIDAICRTRGSLSGSTGVHDTVVNQLLAKLDGVEQLNNILLIGMTNRKDMIDEALLRPGRLEVQMEIGLPNEQGRVEILDIHTSLMRKHKKLGPDVNIEELAKRTQNFSGAELEGLVRSAQATAMNKLIKAKDKVSVTHEEAEHLKVTKVDFEHALLYDLKPAFGVSDKQLEVHVHNGVIHWGPQVQEIVDTGKEAVQDVADNPSTPLMSLLLQGDSGCGKTALAAYLAKLSEFPFVKIISPENMVGFSEAAKCSAIKKIFEDAYKSEMSCVLIDDIDRLLDYVAIGPRFSNLVLQALLVLLRQLPPMGVGNNFHKLLIIGTTGLDSDVLNLTGIGDAFNNLIHVPYLRHGNEIMTVLRDTNMCQFSEDELSALQTRLKGKSCFIGIKKLLSIVGAVRKNENRRDALIKKLEMKAKLQK